MCDHIRTYNPNLSQTLVYFKNSWPIKLRRGYVELTKSYKTFMQSWRLSRNKNKNRVPGKNAHRACFPGTLFIKLHSKMKANFKWTLSKYKFVSRNINYILTDIVNSKIFLQLAF